MSEPIKLGQLLEGRQHRDAVHVAIAPVIAVEDLRPGDHVGFVGLGPTKVGKGSTELIGIVDPFLTQDLVPGDQFWLFLYPQTITSLRHDWTHPAFQRATHVTTAVVSRGFALDGTLPHIPEAAEVVQAPSPVEQSEAWIKRFAEDRLGFSAWRVMNAADAYDGYNEYESDNSEGYKSINSEEWDEFWHHYQIVTGRPLRNRYHGCFYTCSC